MGSQAVQELHRRRNDSGDDSRLTAAETSGSESSEDLLDDTQHVSYDGTLSDGPLRRWLGQKKPGQTAKGKPAKSLQLLSAPVLVCTIDHLMPATEGVRGGKQIAPMLRLLTSDLVLDEPDDFDSADLPALCRLVNWAGLLGSRVLLSSASMPPAMLTALFSAYRAGRAQFDKACGTHGQVTEVCCAWFDEFDSTASQCVDQQAFKAANAEFVAARVKHLQPDLQPGKALRCAEVLDVNTENSSKQEVINAIRESCWQGMTRLHQAHAKADPKTGMRVSVGLIRMANINPLVALAKQLIEGDIPDDTRLHLCVYHSQHPLLVRSHIEKRLDHTLNRKQPEDLWQQPEIRAALDAHPEQNHLFVVLGSPVTEVGRDHDYDWAIAEPSSMRSLIQLAGRVQRHRKQPPEAANMLVLNQNVKILTGTPLGYSQPGFEAKAIGRGKPVLLLQLKAAYQSMTTAIASEDLGAVSSIPRIESRPNRQPRHSLVDLEQVHLGAALDSSLPVSIAGRIKADQWWRIQPSPSWHAETQRLSPFRKSAPDDAYVLYQEEDDEELIFCRLGDHQPEPVPVTDQFERVELASNGSVSCWIDGDPERLISHLAKELGQEVSSVSRRFGEIRLRRLSDSGAEVWQYHPWLGVFRSLKE
jgi:CRISPR-associated endonuclease/helicase Cas3